MTKHPVITLKPGRDKSLKARHPWVFSGAIHHVDGDPANGATVRVKSAEGADLALAAYSPHSQIRARVWSFDVQSTIDAAWFETQVKRAVDRRSGFATDDGGVRLVHAESDGVAGLIVDRYAHQLVVQFLSAGAEAWRDEIVSTLVGATGIDRIYERSDADVRHLEGLAPRSGPLAGLPAHSLTIVEHGLRYAVDVAAGHKTGFYLDQRDNRALIERHAAGARVLNCFCYTGGFSLAALRGGAEDVLSIDASAEAIMLAEKNLTANSLDARRARWKVGDVFAELRTLRDRAEKFDLIVLDPPKFAPTEKHIDKAARAYKDINLLALKLLKPGGALATFSCSGAISHDLFHKIVAGAAIDARVDAVVEQHLHASRDHPLSLTFPEGEYLKGLLVRKY